MIIYIHRDWKINYVEAMEEIISRNEYGQEVFGTF